MKIEDILKGLITVIEQDGSVEINSKECELLINYIVDLQRKEYNNSKAIEYIKGMEEIPYNQIDIDLVIDKLLNILKGE